MSAVDRSILWRAALVQALTVTALALVLAFTLPHSFFEDWGWLTGPLAWIGCAAVTAWALHLHLRRTLLGAVLAGVLSALAVLVGVHWLGVVVAIGAFAAWCARTPRPAEKAAWT
jgi:hypothetical protein